MMDLDMLSKLKKENTHLRQQLTYQSNDILSDSQIRVRNINHHRTVEQHETITSDKSN